MLALDFALFIRNSSTKLGLSLNAIAVGYALAFRIGSNKYSWVKQETLAIELGIIERNVRNNCKKLEEAGLLIIKSSKTDKRKNTYSFNSCIFGYHGMNDDEKKKCHESLVDNFLLTGRNRPEDCEYTGRNQPVYTGQNRPVVKKKKSKINQSNQSFKWSRSQPKVKALKDIKSKEPSAPRKNRALISENFYPNQDNQRLCDRIALNCGTTGIDLIRKFIDVQQRYSTQSDDFDRNFKEFLEREMPSKIRYKK